MSTSKQRQIIGFLRKSLNLEEEIYREILANFNAESSKDLTDKDANILILQLRKNATDLGVIKPYKYNDLSNRSNNMASPKQLRMIEAMWFDISFKSSESERKKAFEHFIFKITGKQKLRFLTAVDIRKIKNAIEHMKG